MTRIVGVDPSLLATGVALPDGTTTTVRARVVDPSEARLNQLATDVWNLLAPHRPEVAVMEDLPLHAPGVDGLVRRAKLVGCFERDLRRGFPNGQGGTQRCQIVRVNPTTLKAWAAHGGADKDEMIEAARAAGGHPANDDEADAYLLRALGLLTVDDIDLFNAPEKRRRRLRLADELGWPHELLEVSHAR